MFHDNQQFRLKTLPLSDESSYTLLYLCLLLYNLPLNINYQLFYKRCNHNYAIFLYCLQVIDHYENPRNVGSLNKNDKNVGTGLVGAPACGDVMKLQIKVDEYGKIIDAKFKTFGCGSAIASSSLATEWVKGKTVSDFLYLPYIYLK